MKSKSFQKHGRKDLDDGDMMGLTGYMILQYLGLMHGNDGLLGERLAKTWMNDR